MTLSILAVHASGVEALTTLLCQPQSGQGFPVTPEMAPAIGFQEFGCYHLSLDHNTPCKLLVDEVELAVVGLDMQNVWEWRPGFYAGEVLAELIDSDGISLARYRLDVSPDPAKLGSVAFQKMVDALFDFDPRLLIGTEAAQLGIGVDGEISEPNLEYARLRRYGSQLLAALSALSARPLTSLTHDRSWRAAHQVKRLDQQSVISIARNPFAVALLQDNAEFDGGNTAFFDVAQSRVELDTPAHRTLFFITQAVIRRARSVIEALTKIANSETPSESRTALTPRLNYRLKILSNLESDLRRITKRTPFSEVTRREVSAAGLNVISAHPLYARAFRTGWHILRPGIAGDRREETLWMSPTWEVYERWCFLTTYHALRSAFPSLAWQRHYPTSRDDCILFTGTGEGLTVRLYSQPRFPAYDQTRWHSFFSISGERIPDIVITYESTSVSRLLVLDAKYRTSRKNVLDAMQSAHLYRDSLRWKDIAPDVALLFVPAGGGAPWLEDEKFWAQYHVGVIPVSPGTSIVSLAETLKTALGLPSYAFHSTVSDGV